MSVFSDGAYCKHPRYFWWWLGWQPGRCNVSDLKCRRLDRQSNSHSTVCNFVYPHVLHQILWHYYDAGTPLFSRILGRSVIREAYSGCRWTSTELHVTDNDIVVLEIPIVGTGCLPMVSPRTNNGSVHIS